VTSVDNGDPAFLVSYNGGFVPTFFGNHPDPPPFALAWDTNPDPNYGDATQYGADGWNRSKPSLQGVDLAAALYELQEFPDQLRTSAEGFKDLFHSSMESVGIGLRSKAAGRILQDQAMNPEYLAEHFLNWAFGWAPFVKDLTDTLNAAHGFKKAFEQHKRDNGRWVRRRRNVVKSLTSTTELFDDHYAYVAPDIGSLSRWDYSPNGNLTRGYSQFIHETELHAWFSGTFKYWVPDLVHDEYDKLAHIRNIARYYGLRVNPAVIWKLTPWSWMADWFGKASQVRSAILDAPEDNLVAKYAYVMCTLIKRTRHFATVFLADGRNANCAWTSFVESKRRSRASPFGFGLSASNLSSKQLAILASLGITRI
jgi:hypothetical protein